MHRRLETYLADVSERLSLIPVNERAEELREMQVHLEQIVAQHQEHGLSEDDAVTITLARFGEPQAVGQDLVTAWQRGESLKNKRSLWSVAACVVVLNVVTGIVHNLLYRSLLAPLWRPTNMDHFHMISLIGCILGLNIVSRVITGGFSGFLFPRRAVAGTVLGMAGWCIYETIQDFHISARLPHEFWTTHGLVQIVGMDLGSILILSLGVTMLASWGGSRLRMRRELALAR